MGIEIEDSEGDGPMRSAVEESGQAFAAGLRKGDLLRRINGRGSNSAGRLKRRLERLLRGQAQRSLRVEVERTAETRRTDPRMRKRRVSA